MKRSYSLDVVRVLCTFWIVCVWHLSNYAESWDISDNAVCQHITRGVLFCFMFLSGLLLKKYEFTTKTSVLEFFKKRLIRFYPLFFLSALSLYLGGLLLGYPWFKDIHHFILCILGLSSFSMPQPSTLWFMSMLMFFYIITPLVKKWKNVGVVLIISLFVIYYFVRNGKADISFIPYCIGYFTGLLSSERIVEVVNKSWVSRLFSLFSIVLILLLGAYLNSIISNNRIILTIFTIVTSLILVVFLLSWSEFLTHLSIKGKAAFEKLSYCSFALYLFHRQIYQLLSYAMNHYGMEVGILVQLVVFVPIAVLVSYFIQCTYDAFLKRCSSFHK